MEPYRGDYDSEEPHRHRFHHAPPPPPPRDEEGYGFEEGGGGFAPPPPRFGYTDEGPAPHRHASEFTESRPAHHHVHKTYDHAEYSPAADAVDSGPYLSSHADPYGSSATGSYQSSYKEDEQSAGVDLPQGQVVRIFCKGEPNFNLAVERNTVMMVPANSEDESQQWIKDASYGLRVKDNYGHPAFSLVNKKTRKILKHAKEKGQQVLLMDYRSDVKDDDILWSESQDFGEGYKTVRSASDTLLNLTVFEGNKRIRNGSALVLDTWHKGDHQLWKIFPM